MGFELIRRSQPLLAALLLTAAAGTGCADPSAAEGANRTKTEKTRLTVAAIPASSSGPLYIAQQRGFFREEGLSVQIKMFPGGEAALPELLRGNIDVMISGDISVVLAHQNGPPMKILGEIDSVPDGAFQIVVPPNSRIRFPRDLKGKRIAVNTRKNLAELACSITLQLENIEAREEVKFVEVPFPKMPKALKDGVVDAAWMFDPFLALAEQQGVRRVVDTTVGPMRSLPTTMYASTAEFTQRYPGTARAFQRAVNRAQRVAAEDREVLDDAVAAMLKLDRRFVSAIQLSTIVTSTNPVRLQRVSDLMLRFGYLRKRVEVRTMIY
jgi:NitT/TauT family transport system substrate-binding protein